MTTRYDAVAVRRYKDRDGNEISIDLLRRLLRADTETGKLFWLERGRDLFSDRGIGQSAHALRWNKKHAGKEAFTTVNSNGYLHGAIFGRNYRAHKVVFALTYGVWPDGDVDHINGVRTDNRPGNLRACSRSINIKNSKKTRANKSGTVGVHFDNGRGKWMAYYSDRDGKVHRKRFESQLEAIAYRSSGASQNGYSERHGQ